MAHSPSTPGIVTARLDADTLGENFADLHEPLTLHEARVEADRCYFCYDAPCMNACPTAIDIPLFIRQIASDNPNGSAKTILESNIMGGMCARVCPTETLCEEVCVRETAEGQPVKIGQLQRFATDHLMATTSAHPFTRAPATGKRIAVIGAGPAGLSCAHRLAVHGHDVTIFEARDKSGGLNEFGIASYKSTDNFAAREIAFIQSVGGITIETGRAVSPDDLTGFDATFIGAGLPRTNGIDMPGAEHCTDAVDYIAQLRQSDLTTMPVGRHIVVIGGGMTAIDVATQTKLLGAENVTIAYRRGPDDMNASVYEQEVAKSAGVTIRHWMQPMEASKGTITLEYTQQNGKLTGTGETLTLPADQIFLAIGQKPTPIPDLDLAASGRILVDEHQRTSRAGVWAGGDCIEGDEDLTVVAVEHGKLAAEDIHATLSGN